MQRPVRAPFPVSNSPRLDPYPRGIRTLAFPRSCTRFKSRTATRHGSSIGVDQAGGFKNVDPSAQESLHSVPVCWLAALKSGQAMPTDGKLAHFLASWKSLH